MDIATLEIGGAKERWLKRYDGLKSEPDRRNKVPLRVRLIDTATPHLGSCSTHTQSPNLNGYPDFGTFSLFEHSSGYVTRKYQDYTTNSWVTITCTILPGS
jgi:hypothetical protein